MDSTIFEASTMAMPRWNLRYPGAARLDAVSPQITQVRGVTRLKNLNMGLDFVRLPLGSAILGSTVHQRLGKLSRCGQAGFEDGGAFLQLGDFFF